MLLPDTVVSSQQLLLETAVTAQTGCSNFAASMMLTIVPIYIGCSAVVIRVQKFMCQSMIDLLLTQQVVMAKDYLQSATTNITVCHVHCFHAHSICNVKCKCKLERRCTPSGGLNPPPAWASQVSTRKKLLCTSHPACKWQRQPFKVAYSNLLELSA